MKNYISLSNADLLLITETKNVSAQANKCVAKIWWKGCFRVYHIGFPRGIWLLWKEGEIILDLISSSNEMVNVLIKDKCWVWWLFTVIYASPIKNIRCKLRDALREIKNLNMFPWLIGGDFIEVRNILERKAVVLGQID